MASAPELATPAEVAQAMADLGYGGARGIGGATIGIPLLAIGGAIMVGNELSHINDPHGQNLPSLPDGSTSCTSNGQGASGANGTDKNPHLKVQEGEVYSIPIGATKEDVDQFREDRKNGDLNAQEKLNKRVQDRLNGGKNSSQSPTETSRMRYVNPGTHDPSSDEYKANKSVLPDNHEELWKNSVADPDDPHTRWTKVGEGKKAVYHRFVESNGEWHWNGSTDGKTKSGENRVIPEQKVPAEVKRMKND